MLANLSFNAWFLLSQSGHNTSMMTGWRARHKLPVMLVPNRGKWFKGLPALEDRLDSEVWRPLAP